MHPDVYDLKQHSLRPAPLKPPPNYPVPHKIFILLRSVLLAVNEEITHFSNLKARFSHSIWKKITPQMQN